MSYSGLVGFGLTGLGFVDTLLCVFERLPWRLF